MNTSPPHCGKPLEELAICILTKYWDAGQVKTRLAKTIGSRAAALIHREFTMFLCESLAHCGNRRSLNLTPPNRATKVKYELCQLSIQDRWQIEDQGTGDLGTRMLNWFNRHATAKQKTPQLAIMIGADCPLLNNSHIESAAQCLNSVDVVLGPARDGGYYLIGFRSTLREEIRRILFEKMQWSTQSVLSETRQRLKRHGVEWEEIKQEEDIDTVFDLRRFINFLRDANSSPRSQSEAHRQNLLYQRLQTIISNCSPAAKLLIYDQRNQL